MCGRYTNELEFSQLKLAFLASDATFRPWVPAYNISPSAQGGHEQPFVLQPKDGPRELRLGRFWFIPCFWTKPLSALPTLFNARAEEVQRKQIWKGAFETSRCLIPATGWREFVGSSRPKQPYHFCLDGELFAFAGLASRWLSPDGERVDSFAIITTPPSKRAAEIHDRMPLIMPEALHDAWLDPNTRGQPSLERAQAVSLEQNLAIFPTSPVGNRPGVEGKEVIAPLSASDAAAAATPPRAPGHPQAQLSLPLEAPPGPKRN